MSRIQSSFVSCQGVCTQASRNEGVCGCDLRGFGLGAEGSVGDVAGGKVADASGKLAGDLMKQKLGMRSVSPVADETSAEA